MDLSRNTWDSPVVVLDCETTGLPENGGKAVEFAAVRFESGLPVARWSSLINPGVPIPEQATAIHGIKDSDVSNAPRLVECAGQILRVCRDAVPCAYSCNFDRHMLHAEITGTDCPAFDPVQSWVDVLVLVKHFDRYVGGKGRHRLTETCKRHGIELTGAHRAEADAMATGFLLWKFKPKLGDMSAAELIRRCDVRRAEQEAEFQRWKSNQKAG